MGASDLSLTRVNFKAIFERNDLKLPDFNTKSAHLIGSLNFNQLAK